MVRTTVFRNNRTQAVRLPKTVALPDDVREVEVRTVGRARVIEPVGSSWDDWFDHGPRVSDDFMSRDLSDPRAQGAADEREPL